MSSDDQRITTDQLQTLIRVATVDELERWDEAPWGSYDIGQQTIRDTVFGKLTLPVIHNGKVRLGSRVVDGERIEPKDGGRILVIDLDPLGWSEQRAKAAVLGEMLGEREATIDEVLLGELVTDIASYDLSLTEAAGMDGDDIDALLEALNSDPSDFDDDGHGSGERTVTCPDCGALVTV